MVTNAVSEMRRYYSRKVIDVLIKVTRSSLDTLRKMFIEDPDAGTANLFVKPVFLLHSTLMIPNVSIHPSLEELQEVLVTVGRNITGVSKGVAQWSSGSKEIVRHNKHIYTYLLYYFYIVSFNQVTHPVLRPSRHINNNSEKARLRRLYCLQSLERPQVPHMTKSFYSYILENKEVVKTLNQLASCTKHVKSEFQGFIKRWKPYHFLWKNERSTRELMEYGLIEFETTLRCLADLDANLLVEPDQTKLSGCIMLSTEKLKFGLMIEIKCKLLLFNCGEYFVKYKKHVKYIFQISASI